MINERLCVSHYQVVKYLNNILPGVLLVQTFVASEMRAYISWWLGGILVATNWIHGNGMVWRTRVLRFTSTLAKINKNKNKNYPSYILAPSKL
jgi:hypothetical protein